MAFEVFRQRAFQAPALKTIEQANTIIDEYQAQGFMLSLRQLHYQFVARDLYANTHANYKLLGRTMVHARDAGLVDWDAVEDRSRRDYSPSSWHSPAEIIAAAASSYREDLWLGGQGHRCEVWVEKDALTDILDPVCRELRVKYTATRGNDSQLRLYAVGKRLAGYIEDGFTPVVLYLGDHDPSGIDMTRDVTDRLSLYAGVPQVRRIGLNMDQVERYRPPLNPVKEADANTASYKIRFGTDECWELDALAPNVIADLIKTEIEFLIDKKAWAKAEKKEARYRRKLAAVADGMTNGELK